METAALCIQVSGPDPKLAKSKLTAFHRNQDGIITTSGAGFVLHAAEGDRPIVVCTLSLLFPFLSAAARRGPLSNVTSASLLPAVTISALLPCGRCMPLALAGLAELPGVAGALRRLLKAPSTAGGGWQVGWLLQQERWPDWSEATVAAHIAALALPSHADVQAVSSLQAMALPAHSTAAASTLLWQPGMHVLAAGAAFGSLSEQHFVSFVSAGVISLAVSAPSRSSPSGSSSVGKAAQRQPPDIVLLDLRCLPGMEGGPVFAAADAQRIFSSNGSTAGAWAAHSLTEPRQLAKAKIDSWQLLGMLLPPLKAPAVQVEVALLAPLPAVLHAARLAAGASISEATAGNTCSSIEPAEAGSKCDAGAVVQPCASAAAIAAESDELPAAQDAAVDTPLSGAGAALSQAMAAVVAVAVGSTWATGVLISSAGHILTNAHVLDPPGAASAASDTRHPAVRVLLGGHSRYGGSSRQAQEWHAANVLHVFQAPLDLAVLQLCAFCSTSASTASPAKQHALPRLPRPLQLCRNAPCPGQQVCTVGFPVFNPSARLAPLVTAGTLARVVPRPNAEGGSSVADSIASGPAMLLTTAAVHSGASGGAVLDPRSGEVLGLLTSNARHSASSTVLPHLNFSIPATLLAPVVAAAAEAATAAGSAQREAATATALAHWQELGRAAAADAALCQVWQLGLAQRQQQQKDGKEHAKEGKGGQQAGAFHGARPPTKLLVLLNDLEKQSLQHQQSRL